MMRSEEFRVSPLRGVVVQEESCPLEGWDDAVRGKLCRWTSATAST
jgi:hypothetical protein